MTRLSPEQENRLGATWFAVVLAVLLGGAVTSGISYLTSGLDLSLNIFVIIFVVVPIALLLLLGPTLLLILLFVRRFASVPMEAITLFVVPWSFFLAFIILLVVSALVSGIGLDVDNIVFQTITSIVFLGLGSLFSARRILIRSLPSSEEQSA